MWFQIVNLLRLYIAGHLDKTGDSAGALATIDAAIEVSDVVEFRLAKARFLKHAGDLQSAAVAADEARAADKADRYLNSMCVKRMLQVGMYNRL